MKKQILAIVCVLALTLTMLAGCGGNSANNGDNSMPNVVTDSSNTAAGNSSGNADTSTVAGFLGQYGLTEDSVKPEDSVSSAMNGHSRVDFGVSSQPTTDQKVSWVGKVIAAVKAAADDGKIYTNSQKDTVYDESVLSTTTGGDFSFVFTHSGKSYWVEIDTEGFPLDEQYSLSITTP